MASEEARLRAVKMLLLPAVRRGEVCRRFGLTAAALRRARAELAPRLAGYPSREEILLGALTAAGEHAEGPVGDLAALAAYLDHVNHDGTSAAEVGAMLRALAAAGRIVLGDGRWRLVGEFP
jgi:hypothetical protein